jgi:Ca2+-binding RTX toxin-like protein
LQSVLGNERTLRPSWALWTALGLLLAFWLVEPAVASAAGVVSRRGSVNFIAGVGDQNDVTVSLNPGEYVIRDADALVFVDSLSPTCHAIDAHTVGCSYLSVGDSVLVASGDKDDTVNVTAPVPASVCAGDGNDTVFGGPADDFLIGGNGNDQLEGGPGRDTLEAGDNCAGDFAPLEAGPDTLRGGDGDDILIGDDGNDLIDGGAGDDNVTGFAGDDTLHGDDGNDAVIGYGGADMLYGDAGDDLVGGGDGDDTLSGGDGNDVLGVTFARDGAIFATDDGNDLMEGGAGDDTLNGGPGGAAVNYGGAAQIVTAAPNGSDTLSGGEGSDTVTYANRSSAVAVAIDGAANDGAVGEKDKVDPDVETLVGGSGDDKLKAGSLAVTLDGGDGDDSLSGSNGGDTLNGGDGDDTLKGGRGDDVEHGNAGDDTAFGGSGADTLDGAGGEDFLDGAAGPDDLKGGNGNDTLHSRDKAGKNKVDCGKGADFDIAAPRSKRKGCEDIDDDRGDRAVRGKRVALKPLGDELELEVPTMDRFVPLEDHVNAPVGSSIDATNGAIKLTSAGAVGGGASASRRPRSKKQTGVFSGGKFVVSQRRSRKAPTELRLKSNYKTCGGAKKGARSSRRHRTLLQRLLGRAHGHFRTRGKYSSAEATKPATWTTEDRCNGTLTRVRTGRVTVVDKRGSRHSVRAGSSYLAKALRSHR